MIIIIIESITISAIKKYITVTISYSVIESVVHPISSVMGENKYDESSAFRLSPLQVRRVLHHPMHL